MGFLIWSLILAVPFDFIWNALAPIYFYWLPPVYQNLPFWHCMGLIVLLAIVRAVIFPLCQLKVKKSLWG